MPRERDAEKVLFMMVGDGSLGSQSCNTIHSSIRHCNDDDEISEEEDIEVSLVGYSRGNRSLETRHSSSSNCGGRESRRNRSQETSHHTPNNFRGRGRRSSFSSYSISRNNEGYVDRGESRSVILPLEIGEQELMLKGEVGIGLRPATINPITKANVVDC